MIAGYDKQKTKHRPENGSAASLSYLDHTVDAPTNGREA